MREVQKIDISSSTIFRVILILLGVWVLYLVREVLLVLLAAVVLSSAIEPMARWLRQYHIPRALSVVIVYVAFLALVATSITLIVPALAEQSVQLAQALPNMVGELEERFAIGPAALPDPVIQQVQEGLQQIGDVLANLGVNIFQRTGAVITTLFAVIFVFILTFYLVIQEDALKRFFRFLIPKQHVPYVELIVDRVQYKLGRWVLAQLALAVIVGVTVGVGLWLLGVPHALALGLIAGVLEVIPIIGPIIAGFFGVTVALSHSLWLGLVVLAFYIIVQQTENHVLIPNIMRKATGLNPIVTIIAVLLGGRLAGFAGVLLSVPVATILSIILSDFFTTPAEENSHSTPGE